MKQHFLYIFYLVLFVRCGADPEKQAVEIKAKDSVPVLIKSPVVAAPVLNPDTSYLEYIFKNYGLVNIAELDSSIKIDLRYAGTNNFLKKDMYDGLRNAYFTCETATKLSNAQYFLKQINKDLSLVVLDASRPQHIQQLMWDSLDMIPDIKYNYLAPPYEKSMHNYGCAADLTIIDLSTGKLLDMGSGYDFFGKISEPVYEAKFLKSGELDTAAYKNRKLLRKVMKLAKFNGIKSEWWHFSTATKPEAMAKFKLIK